MATFIGTADPDTLIGGAEDDLIRGLGGADALNGRDGNDTVQGDAGNDTIYGGDGDDLLEGGTGVNLLNERVSTGNDTLLGGDGPDELWGGPGNDRLVGGAHVDGLYGDDGNDTLDGNSHSDVLSGGDGNDWLLGGGGGDFLLPGRGSDTVEGGDGTDTLVLTPDHLPFSRLHDPDFSVEDLGNWIRLRGTEAETGAEGLLVSKTVERVAFREDAIGGGLDILLSRLLDLDSLPRDDYAGDRSTAGRIAVGGSVTGEIEIDMDVDWFAITLQAGQRYRIDVSSPSADDPVFNGIYDADGTLLPGTTNDDGPVTLDSLVWFTPAATGTYYMSPGVLYGSGEYTLSVTAIVDDIGDTPATAVPLAVNGTASGRIETPGDTDWFAIELQAGQDYRLEVDADFHFLTRHAGVFDGAGTLIPGTDSAAALFGFGLLTAQDFTAPTTGTFYLAAGSRQNDTGGYSVRATHLVDDHGADIASAGQITVGGPAVSGGIQRLDDQDWFAVDLLAGQSYRAVMSTNGNWENGDLPTPQILGVFAPDGQAIPGAGDNPRTYWQAADSLFTASQTGTHHIILAGDGLYGAYSLEVVQRVTLLGTADRDWLSLPGTGPVDLAGVQGGGGVDMLSMAGLDAAIYANMATGELRSLFSAAPIDLVMEDIEQVTGTAHDDWFVGSDRSEQFRGLGGRDLFVDGGAGLDQYDGGAGRDQLSYLGADSGVAVSLLRGLGWSGDAAGDHIRRIEDVTGSAHDDFFWGDHQVNWLNGRWGDDTLVGNGGNDVLIGDLGTDVALYGGNRADYTITGDSTRAEVIAQTTGEGHDILIGVEVLRFADGELIL